MSDESTQPADATTEEQTKGSLGGTSKGSQGSYGTRAPETSNTTSTGGTSKGNSGSFGGG